MSSSGTVSNPNKSKDILFTLLFVFAGLAVGLGFMFMAFYAEDTIMPWYLGKPGGKTMIFTPTPKIIEPHPQPIPAAPAVIPAAPEDPGLTVRDGLVFWLRGDAVPSFHKNGDLVLYMPDASKARNDMRNIYPIARPRYVTTAINNKPALRFNGLDTFIFFDHFALQPTPVSIYVVWARSEYGGQYPGQPDGMSYQRLYSSSAAGTDYEHGGVYSNVYEQSQGVPMVPNKLWAPLMPPQLHKNISAAPLDLRNFWIGRLNTAATQFFSGDIAEFLVYTRALTPQEQAAVERYLKTKYSLL